ncbi:MAG TPA: hypothetical protein VHW66_13620 [Stellaceae bacterium]|jgi:hypothetical protein|nr:hypothetical protein [Stellaceae bacterium]
MTLLRIAAIGLLACFGAAGCDYGGGPQRASDIQNLHGISDDISATTMTDSDRRWAHDPNTPTTLPNTYETHDAP